MISGRTLLGVAPRFPTPRDASRLAARFSGVVFKNTGWKRVLRALLVELFDEGRDGLEVSRWGVFQHRGTLLGGWTR